MLQQSLSQHETQALGDLSNEPETFEHTKLLDSHDARDIENQAHMSYVQLPTTSNISDPRVHRCAHGEQSQYDYIIKVIFVGDTHTGKTSTLYALQDHAKISPDNPLSTVGVEFGAISMKMDKKFIKYHVWDTAGQEKYRSITASFFKNSAIAVLFCDLTNYKTFQSLPGWLKDIREHSPPCVTIILVANKYDMNRERAIQYTEIADFAEQNNLLYIESSSILQDRIESILLEPTKVILKAIKEKKIKPEDIGIRPNNFIEIKTGTPKICTNCVLM